MGAAKNQYMEDYCESWEDSTPGCGHGRDFTMPCEILVDTILPKYSGGVQP